MFLKKLKDVFFDEFATNKAKLELGEDDTNYYLELFERECANLARLQQSRQIRATQGRAITYSYATTTVEFNNSASNMDESITREDYQVQQNVVERFTH